MHGCRATGFIFTFLALLAASPVVAEVMDKEPTIGGMWSGATMVGVLGAVAWIWNKWAGLGVTLLALFFAWGTHQELTDPFVGPDILREAGPTYIRHAYAAMAASIIPHAFGAMVGLWRRGRRVQAQEAA